MENEQNWPEIFRILREKGLLTQNEGAEEGDLVCKLEGLYNKNKVDCNFWTYPQKDGSREFSEDVFAWGPEGEERTHYIMYIDPTSREVYRVTAIPTRTKSSEQDKYTCMDVELSEGVLKGEESDCPSNDLMTHEEILRWSEEHPHRAMSVGDAAALYRTGVAKAAEIQGELGLAEKLGMPLDKIRPRARQYVGGD